MSLPPPLSSAVPPAPRAVLPPIARWKLVVGVMVVALLTALVVTVLWWAGTRGLAGKDLVTARLDALRVGLSIGIGGGGLFALYLAWRRQRSTEADLDNRERALAHQLQVAADSKAHQERVAAASEADAAERRVTELYTRAVEQLGSDKAPVRLGGLYALERVAQNIPEPQLRQTVVNVLCAYLRMPYTPPSTSSRRLGIHRSRRPQQTPAPDRSGAGVAREELEVRLTAQRILTKHLHPGPAPDTPVDTFWEDIDLDLTDATLVHWNLAGCRVRNATFDSTRFSGDAAFDGARFGGDAEFDGARFGDAARFTETRFDGATGFRGAYFGGDAGFNSARFGGATGFRGARFGGGASFNSARFGGAAGFSGVRFDGGAWFAEAKFGFAEFNLARFGGHAWFTGVEFDGVAGFTEAEFDGVAWFPGAEFGRDARFDGARFGGDAWFTGAKFDDVVFSKAKFAEATWFTEAEFGGDAWFDGAEFGGDALFGGTEFGSDVWFTGARFALSAPPEIAALANPARRDDASDDA